MNRTISFGKIDWYGRGQRDCRAEVELSLEDTDKGAVFAASAYVWDPLGIDIVCGGQCLEELVPFIPDPAFQEIVHLWRRYHLNDMHAGTPEQEAEVKRWLDRRGYEYEYTAAREHLREVGLLTVEHNGKPYTYGTGWLYEPIPADDLARIRDIIERGTIGEEVGA